MSDEVHDGDARHVLDLLQLLHEAKDPDEVSHVLVSQLHRVVPCDLVSFNDIDRTGAGETVTFYEPVLVPRLTLQPAFEALQHEHPLITDYARTGDPGPRRMSDFIALRDFQALDLYREVFRPLESNHQIAFALMTRPGRVIGIGLNRLARDFTQREMDTIGLLQRHLAAAYEHARLRAAEAARSPSELDLLTLREREVLTLVAAGRSDREIARLLFLSPRTVEKHLENVRGKLGVRTRTEAVVRAHGLVPAPGGPAGWS